MDISGTENHQIPLSAAYVAEGTYPAEICVLRYALQRNAREKPDEVFAAFEGGERCATFAQTLRAVESLAGNLHRLGVRQGDHVVLVLPTSPLALRVMFAINYLGAVYVPVNPALKGSSLDHVLHNAGAGLAVVHDNVLDRVLAAASPALVTVVRSSDDETRQPTEAVAIHGVSALTKASAPPPEPPRPIRPFDTPIHHLYVRHHRPLQGRAVVLHARVFLRRTRCLELPERPRPAIAAHADLSYRRRLHCDRRTLRRQFDRRGQSFPHRSVLGSGARTGSHVAFLLGAMATFLLKQPPDARDRDHGLRMVFIVPLGQSGRAFRERFGVDVVTLFNMTEICTPLISRANPQKDNICGRRRRVEVRLVDEHDCSVRDGEVGQLILRTEAPWAMNHGYNNNPQATADAWRNGWFHTGDAFIRDADGDYRFVDRLKDAIRRRGENISSYEIEVELLSHPAVREAAAIPVPSEFSEDEVMVVLAAAGGASIDPEDIIRHLLPRMARHMVPRYIRIIDELPKTPTAKVEKHLLRAQGLTDDTWDRERAGIVLRREAI